MPLAADEDKRLNKMDVRMLDGIWLGTDGRDGSVRIGTSSGVVMARTVRRKPEASRWVHLEVDEIEGTIWNPATGIDASAQRKIATTPAGEQ